MSPEGQCFLFAPKTLWVRITLQLGSHKPYPFLYQGDGKGQGETDQQQIYQILIYIDIYINVNSKSCFDIKQHCPNRNETHVKLKILVALLKKVIKW